jgi:hypothetical protein
MNVIALLQLGALGLGALVFLLTYRLISTHLEHRRARTAGDGQVEADGDRDLGRTIRTFLYVGVAAYLVAATAEVIGWVINPERHFSYTVSPELTELGYPDLEVMRADSGEVYEKSRRYAIDSSIPLRIGADDIMVKAGNYRVQAVDAIVQASRIAEANATLAQTVTELIANPQASSSLPQEPVREAISQSSDALRNLRNVTTAIR